MVSRAPTSTWHNRAQVWGEVRVDPLDTLRKRRKRSEVGTPLQFDELKGGQAGQVGQGGEGRCADEAQPLQSIHPVQGGQSGDQRVCVQAETRARSEAAAPDLCLKSGQVLIPQHLPAQIDRPLPSRRVIADEGMAEDGDHSSL
jgi:hypothetical protein